MPHTFDQRLEQETNQIVSKLENIDFDFPEPLDYINLMISLDKCSFLVFNTDISELLSINIYNIRKYHEILERLEIISESLKKLMNNTDCYSHPSEIEQWAMLVRDDYFDEDVYFEPSEIEKEIAKHIEEYSGFSRSLTNKFLPTFTKLSEKFIDRVKEFKACVEDDSILTNIYDEFKTRLKQEIIDTTDSEVAKNCKKINVEKQDYVEYFFHYLEHLKINEDENPAIKYLIKAHVIHKPVLVTNKYIKYCILRATDTSIEQNRRLLSSIIKLNYLKEKCGDIGPENNYQENRNNLDQEDNLLKSRRAIELWEKAKNANLVDENYKPMISDSKASILAFLIGSALKLSPMWAPFEKLWCIKNLTNKYSQVTNRKFFSDVKKQYARVLGIKISLK